MTNKVSHYGQFILFGCGYISSKDINTFVRLFDLWLKCMPGLAHNPIITYQDKAMKVIIVIEFSRVKHRFYLWHMLNKPSTKVGSRFQYESTSSALLNYVYDTLTCDDFEKRW